MAGKLMQFLQSSNGELSSKRLAFILSNTVFIIGSFIFTFYSLRKGEWSIAYEFWSSFGMYCAVLGGYVTSELFSKKLNKQNATDTTNS